MTETEPLREMLTALGDRLEAGDAQAALTAVADLLTTDLGPADLATATRRLRAETPPPAQDGGQE